MLGHKAPRLTVDIIILYNEGVVLVERKNPPYGWALPGGFVEYGETAEEAAAREAKEETDLELHDLRQFHVYSSPKRDPRHHTVSVVFTAVGKGSLKPGDDAKSCKTLSKGELPELAFDHKKILQDYFERER